MAEIKVYFYCVKAYNPPTQRIRWVIQKFSASIHYFLSTNKIWINNGSEFENYVNGRMVAYDPLVENAYCKGDVSLKKWNSF